MTWLLPQSTRGYANTDPGISAGHGDAGNGPSGFDQWLGCFQRIFEFTALTLGQCNIS